MGLVCLEVFVTIPANFTVLLSTERPRPKPCLSYETYNPTPTGFNIDRKHGNGTVERFEGNFGYLDVMILKRLEWMGEAPNRWLDYWTVVLRYASDNHVCGLLRFNPRKDKFPNKRRWWELWMKDTNETEYPYGACVREFMTRTRYDTCDAGTRVDRVFPGVHLSPRPELRRYTGYTGAKFHPALSAE
ncbi:uncharacterized protein LOC144143027 [Haemaphysalis longicornis]